MTLREIQPYETLKAALDEAHDNFRAKLDNLTRHVNHQDGPMLLLIDIEEVYAAHAVLESRIEAFTREYGHMAEANENLRKQRDETNRKFEAFKRTLNQLNLDDEASTKDTNTNTNTRSKRRKK